MRKLDTKSDDWTPPRGALWELLYTLCAIFAEIRSINQIKVSVATRAMIVDAFELLLRVGIFLILSQRREKSLGFGSVPPYRLHKDVHPRPNIDIPVGRSNGYFSKFFLVCMYGSFPIIRVTSFQKAFFAAQIVVQPKERRYVIRSRIGRSVRSTRLGWVVDGLGIVF